MFATAVSFSDFLAHQFQIDIDHDLFALVESVLDRHTILSTDENDRDLEVLVYLLNMFCHRKE